MENLEAYSTFADALVSVDQHRQIEILEHAWTHVLAPAYLSTRESRMIPNVVEDYFGRADARLSAAAKLGLLPSRGTRFSIRSDTDTFEFDNGWGPVLDEARARLLRVAPSFSTFVHGDPNPENILWELGEDEQIRIRLIDPKDWRNGDYVFDAAKIGHYLRVTSPVEEDPPHVTAEFEPDGGTIEYSRSGLRGHHVVEAKLLELVRTTAEDSSLREHESWAERYELAIAANLLGIAGPRLENGSTSGTSSDSALGWIAFAEGLRVLVDR